MKLLHTMIRVKDIDASLKFYTELLNMKIDKQKDWKTVHFISLMTKKEPASLNSHTMMKPQKKVTQTVQLSDILHFQLRHWMSLQRK